MNSKIGSEELAGGISLIYGKNVGGRAGKAPITGDFVRARPPTSRLLNSGECFDGLPAGAVGRNKTLDALSRKDFTRINHPF